MKLKIVSDGTPKGTIISTEDGRKIENITNAWVSLDSQDLASVSIEVLVPHLDLVADGGSVTFKCPVCMEVTQHECEGVPALGKSGEKA